VPVYDPQKPLISLHIPKCAGTSFRTVLKNWYADRLFLHYFQQRNDLPPRHPLLPGICIHGHFNLAKGFGAPDYYPEVDQFITILRDPLEMAVSNYFFWKTKGRARQIRDGRLTEDYRDILEFFRKRNVSPMLNFMPRPVTRENYREILERHFVGIGFVEDLQSSLDRLAHALGFPPTNIGRINASPRDEDLPAEIRDGFMDANSLEYEVYRHAWRLFGTEPRGDHGAG
jgi:hypothetical protein